MTPSRSRKTYSIEAKQGDCLSAFIPLPSYLYSSASSPAAFLRAWLTDYDADHSCIDDLFRSPGRTLGSDPAAWLQPEIAGRSSASEVFTNGCFDILHVGHIALLDECRRFGGKVVVGVNSDASVSRLKGPVRTKVGERERARILAALAATDAVVLFDAPTPIELILALRPEVLVKGGDYTEENIVGAAEVKNWDGRVVIVSTVEGFGTTSIVRKRAGHDGNAA